MKYVSFHNKIKKMYEDKSININKGIFADRIPDIIKAIIHEYIINYTDGI